MSEKHVVKQGETLSSIAAQHGFANFHTIFDRPENAELRQKRSNAHALFPGDEVFIPDREPRTESIPTGQRSIFEADVPKLFMRLRIRNLNDEKLPPDKLVLFGDKDFARQERLFPDGDGIIEKEIAPTVELAQVTFTGDGGEIITMHLEVGSLDPVNTLSGQRARLNNLGFYAGYKQFDTKQFRWGAEEFKKDKGLNPVAVKESDIDFIQGVKDPAFRSRLEKEHGS
jgi:hypothetical protein